ncbi:MAG: LuxR C-terminal-related transcriptional regulator [Candidatus Tyrphobacter sp.]
MEPQVVIAKALSQFLRGHAHVHVVGEAQEAGADAIARANADIVLIDGDGDAAALATTIRVLKSDERIQAKICVFSMHVHAERAMRALFAGADAYIVKDVSPSDFFVALDSVVQQGIYVDPRISNVLLRRRIDRTWLDVEALSPRETEIVRLIAQGLSNKEISKALMLADKTVKNHITNIFSKLNCTARTQVAIYAIRQGLA